MDIIVNWLWQGAVVAGIATVVLRCTRRLSATMRHRLWWIALVLVLSVPVVPMVQAGWSTDVSVASTLAPAMTPSAYVIPIQPASWWMLASLAALWFAWFALTLARTIAALVTLNRAKRCTQAFPADREAKLTLWNSVRGHGRPARLVLSDDVRLAAVLGLRSPVIAVAPELLERLTASELDRIVVHEWAHVQRRDDVMRLCQMLLGALAGLHPAVRWIDRQIQFEREIACDDWAINLTGSAKTYAACLTKLALLGRREHASLVPAAISSSQLTRRIARLLDASRSTSTNITLGPVAAVGASMLVVAAIVANIELVVIAASIETPISTVQSGVLSITPSLPLLPVSPNDQTRAAQRDAQKTSTLTVEATVSSQATPAAAVQPPTPEPNSTTPARSPAEFPVPIEPSGGISILPGSQLPVALPQAPDVKPQSSNDAPTPWGAAADAGVGIGRGSQKAAVVTAGFFTRFSKSIAGSFK